MLKVSKSDVVLAYQSALSTQEGQIVLADLMRRFGFTTWSTFVEGDPNKTSWQEGQRSVLVHIGRMLEADPAEAEEHEDAET